MIPSAFRRLSALLVLTGLPLIVLMISACTPPQAPEDAVSTDVPIEVHFATHVRDLPLDFTVEAPVQTVRPGETGLTHFLVRNTSDQVVDATAAFKVFPAREAATFVKLECFCFEGRLIQPGQSVAYPLQYYLDPSAPADLQRLDVSFTFYPTEGFNSRRELH